MKRHPSTPGSQASATLWRVTSALREVDGAIAAAVREQRFPLLTDLEDARVCLSDALKKLEGK